MTCEPATFVALDLETTGLSAELDRIVEVGAARFDALGRELGRFQSLVNPLRPVHPRAFAIHGISDQELARAETADVVLARFISWLEESPGSTLLAHNASFDAGFLGAEMARHGVRFPSLEIVDTLPLCRKLMPGLPNHRLDTLAARLGLDPGDSHRALADAVRVMGLWLALCGETVPESVVRYPITPPDGLPPVPSGWDILSEAIALGRTVRIAYEGGTRGLAPREITPRRFRHMGGVAYVVAQCHASAIEKVFRLDRVVWCEVV